MGHRTTRRRASRQKANRPSTFFLIALAIGLIVLVIMAVVLIRRPAVKKASAERSAAVMLVVRDAGVATAARVVAG